MCVITGRVFTINAGRTELFAHGAKFKIDNLKLLHFLLKNKIVISYKATKSLYNIN